MAKKKEEEIKQIAKARKSAQIMGKEDDINTKESEVSRLNTELENLEKEKVSGAPRFNIDMQIKDVKTITEKTRNEISRLKNEISGIEKAEMEKVATEMGTTLEDVEKEVEKAENVLKTAGERREAYTQTMEKRPSWPSVLTTVVLSVTQRREAARKIREDILKGYKKKSDKDKKDVLKDVQKALGVEEPETGGENK